MSRQLVDKTYGSWIIVIHWKFLMQFSLFLKQYFPLQRSVYARFLSIISIIIQTHFPSIFVLQRAAISWFINLSISLVISVPSVCVSLRFLNTLSTTVFNSETFNKSANVPLINARENSILRTAIFICSSLTCFIFREDGITIDVSPSFLTSRKKWRESATKSSRKERSLTSSLTNDVKSFTFSSSSFLVLSLPQLVQIPCKYRLINL